MGVSGKRKAVQEFQLEEFQKKTQKEVTWAGWRERERRWLPFLFLRILKVSPGGGKLIQRVGVPKYRRREIPSLAGFFRLGDDWRFSVSTLVVPTPRPFHLIE
jgi:hypothetical protein